MFREDGGDRGAPESGCRRGAALGGEGGGGGLRGPRHPLSSGSGIFWDNVLEWYINLYEPKDSRRRNAHKNLRDPDFKLFPGEHY